VRRPASMAACTDSKITLDARTTGGLTTLMGRLMPRPAWIGSQPGTLGCPPGKADA
jgi:hypothetical protein